MGLYLDFCPQFRLHIAFDGPLISGSLTLIVGEVFDYISDYKDDLNAVRKLHPKEWQRRYGRSTLPYFESFLRDAAAQR